MHAFKTCTCEDGVVLLRFNGDWVAMLCAAARWNGASYYFYYGAVRKVKGESGSVCIYTSITLFALCRTRKNPHPLKRRCLSLVEPVGSNVLSALNWPT